MRFKCIFFSTTTYKRENQKGIQTRENVCKNQICGSFQGELWYIIAKDSTKHALNEEKMLRKYSGEILIFSSRLKCFRKFYICIKLLFLPEKRIDRKIEWIRFFSPFHYKLHYDITWKINERIHKTIEVLKMVLIRKKSDFPVEWKSLIHIIDSEIVCISCFRLQNNWIHSIWWELFKGI